MNSQLDDFFNLKSEKKPKIQKDGFRERVSKNLNKDKIRLIPKVLSKRERYLILTFALIILAALISIPFTTFYHYTKALPDYGGSFSEGIIGEPHHINPLLSQTSDVDRDLVSLIFSGLMKYNPEGKLVPDIAKSYEVSSDGLNYTIYLKEGAKWHDGTPLTADDVIFTIQVAQNSDYGSPQRINWQGVDVEKVNDYALILKLKNKYAQFLSNLTLRILPKHVWQNIKPINFALSEFNLKPIGSGAYKFKRLKKDDTGKISYYELESNKGFHDGQSYIDKVGLKFYDSEEQMIAAYNKNDIENLSSLSAKNLNKVKFKKRVNINELQLPRYFGVFFNQNQNKTLSDKNVRLALDSGTDKKELIDKILDGKGLETNSPMLGDILGISNTAKHDYDLEKARKLLKDSKLSLRLTTSTWPELTNVASLLKEQWAKLGVDVAVEVLPTAELQQVIKERSYQALLFGEILNIDPDPFSLWHSSQKKDPGLNLALYDNKTADGLLEKARQTLNPLEREKLYEDFQKLIIEDKPAIFLYNPLYIYGQTNNIKGFKSKIISMPSDRFSNVEKWYINTKRRL